MSNFKIGILFLAIALVICGVIFDVAAFRGGSGVIMVVALVYAYRIAQREAALLSYAVKNREEEKGWS